MTPTPRSPDDRALQDLLKQGLAASPRRNPAFRSEVWSRIEARRREPGTWSAWLRLHRLGIAGAALAAVLVAAAGGSRIASLQDQRLRERMMDRYVASIDPHQHLAQGGGR